MFSITATVKKYSDGCSIIYHCPLKDDKMSNAPPFSVTPQSEKWYTVQYTHTAHTVYTVTVHIQYTHSTVYT